MQKTILCLLLWSGCHEEGDYPLPLSWSEVGPCVFPQGALPEPLTPLPAGPPQDAAKAPIPEEIVWWRTNTTPDGWFRAPDIERSVAALAALRGAAPDLAIAIPPRGDHTITVGLNEQPATIEDAPDSLDVADAMYGGERSFPFSVIPELPRLYIRFETPLDTAVVARYYAALSGVRYAEAHVGVSDGNDVIRIEKPERWHLVVKEGRGDCPSGCITNKYTYFTWDLATGQITRDSEGASPEEIPLYGVPDRFSIRPFPSFADLLDAVSDERWWVAQHATHALGMLVCTDNPWVGEDLEPEGHYNLLHAEALDQRVSIAKTLVSLLEHPDAEVRASAHERLVVWSGESYAPDARAQWEDWLSRVDRVR